MRFLGWFAARGWAAGGAVGGGIVAAFTQPPYYLVSQGWAIVVTGLAAVLMGALACWPWIDWLRHLAVVVFALAILSRAFSILALGPGTARYVGATAWILIAYLSTGIGMMTIRAGHDRRN